MQGKNSFLIVSIMLILLVLVSCAEANNIIKVGGDVIVEKGQVVDNVTNIGGQVTINGLVEHNVLAVGGSIVLTNNAVIRGNVVCVGGIVARGNGAQVFGDITEINSSNISNAFSSAFRGELEGWSLIFNIISLCFFAVIFLIALLMTVVLPRPVIAVADEIKNYKTKSIFWGFLATLMIVPFFMLLVISIIGITLIPLIFTMLLLAFIMGYIAAGTLIGNFALTKIFQIQKRLLVRETLLGLILLWLAGWIPYVGWFIKIIALTSGLGGVLLALFNRRPRPAAPQQPPPQIEPEPVNPSAE